MWIEDPVTNAQIEDMARLEMIKKLDDIAKILEESKLLLIELEKLANEMERK